MRRDTLPEGTPRVKADRREKPAAAGRSRVAARGGGDPLCQLRDNEPGQEPPDQRERDQDVGEIGILSNSHAATGAVFGPNPFGVPSLVGPRKRLRHRNETC